MDISADIKAAAKEKRLIMGSKSVIKHVKNGKATSVIYAENLPKSVLRDITRYSAIGSVQLKAFTGNSMELGELCGKPFPVLMLGIRK